MPLDMQRGENPDCSKREYWSIPIPAAKMLFLCSIPKIHLIISQTTWHRTTLPSLCQSGICHSAPAGKKPIFENKVLGN